MWFSPPSPPPPPPRTRPHGYKHGTLHLQQTIPPFDYSCSLAPPVFGLCFVAQVGMEDFTATRPSLVIVLDLQGEAQVLERVNGRRVDPITGEDCYGHNQIWGQIVTATNHSGDKPLR